MKMFNFNPGLYRDAFADQGYTHIKGGLTGEFLETLSHQIDEYVESSRLKEWAIGNKQQSLYSFPEGTDCFHEFLETIGDVCRVDPKKLVLSERHIKVYEPDANPRPLAHKDRFASQISVGLSVDIPRGSKLVLYPYDDVGVNPFNSAARLRASLQPERIPESILQNGRRIEIEDRPGDVIIFRGNAIWHLRENAANTTNLYIKLNGYNCDPLGEDPRTKQVREQTLQAMKMSDPELALMIPMIGRRVDFVHRYYTRQWQEDAEVILWGEKPVTISEQEMFVLKFLDGKTTVGAVLNFSNGAGYANGMSFVRRLAERGVVDLFPAGE